MTKDLMLKLVTDWTDSNRETVIDFIDLVSTTEDLMREITLLKKEKFAAADKYQKELALFDHKLGVIQRECSHAATEYHTGAVGGDSYTECLICGKDLG